MKDYLRSLIYEEIERARFLKSQITYPLRYAELSGLSSRCNNILDEQIISLQHLLEQLESEKYSEKYIWRFLRSIIRSIEITEMYGIPPLKYQPNEVGFLNKLSFRIHDEINLPLEHPAIATFSTNYYYNVTSLNVIFVPLSETNFLLHLSDLYHEIGHHVSQNKEDPKLNPLGIAYNRAFEEVTNYYSNLLIEKTRSSGSEELKFLIQKIHSHWSDWIEEFFCDLFALFLLGPAYAWSNFHLTVKQSDNIYQVEKITQQKHPSFEARMRMLLIGLKILNFNVHVDIEKKWLSSVTQWGSPSVEYQYAYPNSLLEKVAEIIYDGISNCDFNVATTEKIKNENPENIRYILNQAWDLFWRLKPDEFRKWEIKTIEDLKKRFSS